MRLIVRNQLCFWSMIVLSLVIGGFSGCDRKTDDGGPQKPGEESKQISEFLDMDPNKATAKLGEISESIGTDDPSRIRALLQAGADINVRNRYGATPLWMASQNGLVEVVKLLLIADADTTVTVCVGKEDHTPLGIARKMGHDWIADLLRAYGGESLTGQAHRAVATARLRAISQSLTSNDIAEIRTLIRAGADVNTRIRCETRLSHVPSFEEVIGRNRYGTTPLDRAAYYGHTEIAQLFLAAGAEVDAADDFGSTPPHTASYRGHAEIVSLLLAGGADVNNTDKNGFTPMHRALEGENTQIVKLLLAAGADPKAGHKKEMENAVAVQTQEDRGQTGRIAGGSKAQREPLPFAVRFEGLELTSSAQMTMETGALVSESPSLEAMAEAMTQSGTLSGHIETLYVQGIVISLKDGEIKKGLLDTEAFGQLEIALTPTLQVEVRATQEQTRAISGMLAVR